MRAKLCRALALLLCLAICLSFAPAALAEEAFEEAGAFEFEEPAFDEEAAFGEEPEIPEPAEEELPAEEPEPEEPAFEEPAIEEELLTEEEPATEPEEPAWEEPAFEAEEGEEYDAASGTWGELRWTLDGFNCLSITGTGRMNDFDPGDTDSAWRADAGSIGSVRIGSGVTGIGAGAFENCSSLTDVTIPAGVTSIGERAFYACSSLAEVTIPDSVTGIGDYAFCCCSLENVSIPAGVTSIADGLFSACSSLAGVSIPAGVTAIGSCAFEFCWSLTELVIPAGVKSIGTDAFAHCSGLTSVTVPVSVTDIGERAFYTCTSLRDIYYGGSRPQWLAIRVGDENAALQEARLHLTVLDTPVLRSAAAVSGGIRVTWDAVDDAVKYRVYRKYGGGSWTALANTAATAYTDTRVTPDTAYTYTVRCISADGTSAVSGFDTRGVSAVAWFAAPSLVSAEASGASIVFRWNAVPGAGKYRVYRKYGSVNWTAIGDTAATAWTDTAVTVGTTYTYTARCLSADGRTCVSSFDAAGRSAKITGQLAAPTLISATMSDNRVVFKWNAVPGAAMYRVYRKYSGINWKVIGETAAAAYTDTDISVGTTYTYTVRCLSADRKTCVSGFDAAGKSVCVPGQLAAPAPVSATAADNGIVFRWNAVPGAVRYRVYRKYGSGSWTVIGSTNATSYGDRDVVSGTAYTYTVRCLSLDGKRCVSGFNARGVSAVAWYAAPTLVSAQASGESIVFKWNAVPGAARYRVYRRYSGTGWVKLADTAATVYTDTAVTYGTTYTYTARCISADGKAFTSGFDADGRSAVISGVLAKPELLSAEALEYSILVSWQAVEGAPRYVVYRRSSRESWQRLAETGETSYNDATVRAGTTYTYTVCCLSADGSTRISGYDRRGVSARTEIIPVYRALVIGNANYSQSPLPGCRNDMLRMQAMLSGLSKPFACTTLPDATTAQMRSAIHQTFAGAADTDVSLFFYSGHGLSEDSERLGALVGIRMDTLTMTELAAELSQVRGRVIVLLDSCFSGAALVSNGADADARLDAYNQSVIDAFAAFDTTFSPDGALSNTGELKQSKFIVITAAREDETSQEQYESGTRFGVFTRGLVEGCGYRYLGDSFSDAMPGDLNGDRCLSASEAYRYAYDWALTKNHEQHARFYAADPDEILFRRN